MRHQYLVCDGGGRPHHWVKWQDAVVLRYKDLISHEIGKLNVYTGGISRTTGKRSTIEVAPIIFLKEVLNYDTGVPPLTNENLFARDLNICGYCGRHYPTHKLSRDHIQPKSKGGKNTWTNTVTACKSCNRAKGDRLLHEIDMQLIYVPYIPSHAEKLLMQNRHVLADQMDYLSSFLPRQSRILRAPHILGLVN